MKLSGKLSLSMGVLTAVLILLGVFCLYQMDRINDTATVLADRHVPALTYIAEADKLASDYRIVEVMHIYETDSAKMDVLAKSMNDITARLDTVLDKYRAIPRRPLGDQLLQQYDRDRAAFQKIHKKIFTLSQNNATAEAIRILTTESQDLYNKMSASLEKLVDMRIELAGETSAEGDVLYASSRTMVIVGLLAAVLLAIGVSFWIIRNTLSQLGKDPGELAQIARRVTGGDYDIDDGSRKIGVFGNLVGMVQALREHIENARRESERAAEESRNAREAMQRAEEAGEQARAKTEAMLTAADKLEEVAHIVSSASAELSAQIEQSERGASEQAARVAETATAMEEMNSTVLEVAKNAGTASDVSTQTRDKADGGADVVRRAVSAIQDVQQQSLALKEDMATLAGHAQSISQIMGVISDIADQTNLLALNAAIEAARAGEAGRGFAVVADEVRKLAEKTMASTTDVGNAIKAIQDSAEKSMTQVDHAVKTIEEATSLAAQSGDALSEIVNMVDNTAYQVRAIATASEQQSASSEEINQSITQVNTIAGETARAMEEASRAVSDLSNQAQVLTGLIEDMKRG